MAVIFITYWRDIPSQVTARAGRRSEKHLLGERFQQAIDMAAMRAGLTGTDAYLEQWRRGEATDCGDDMAAAVAALADTVERDYDTARLRALIDNGGFDPAS